MRHDAIVIGGSFAGLSAALYIARARRTVCVIDAGRPRNRFAAHSHGFFAQDGAAPAAMLGTARAQVAAYPTVAFVDGAAVDATRTADGFAVTLATGATIDAARLVLAFGLADDLPDLPGLRPRWGRSVIHCPYCHGYEFSGRRLGVLATMPMSSHQAMLISEWGPATFYLNGNAMPDDETLAELRRRQVAIEPAPVVALHGDGGDLSAIELADGRMCDVDALYLAPHSRFGSDLADRLGCEIEAGPMSPMIRTDGWKQTSVQGVFAAGDITRGAHSATWASADGVTAGVALHRSLVF